MSLCINPSQASGIANAVGILLHASTDSDDMAHIHPLQDGSGAVSVALTSVDKRLYVGEDGTVFENMSQLLRSVQEKCL